MPKTTNMPIAELIDNGLVVWNPKEASLLYKLGYYGKPVGISKPKTNEFDEPLILDLIEGVYLLEKKQIKVKYRDKIGISISKVRAYAKKIYKDFRLHYIVYKSLREKGYVVLPGIKFGCEYAIYKRGPGLDHSPYLVTVMKPDDSITSTDIVRAGRLATSVRKKFVIAIPNKKTKEVSYVMFNWFKA